MGNKANAARVPPGVPASGKLSLGISTWNEQAANAIINAFGGSASIGDGEAAAKAIIAYINRTGGIAGRQIDPVYVQFNATSQDSFSQQRQADCAAFTQDHHVFAVVDQVDASAQATMASCLAQRHTVYVESYMRDFLGELTQQLAPYVYEPGDLADSGYATAMNALRAAGYFDPGYKLGVMYIDSPSGQHLYSTVIKPGLEHDGITVSDESAISNPNSVSDAGPLEQQISSTVLRFQSEGINHVLGLSGGGLAYFMVQAEQQHYRPRYAMTSKEQAANLQSAVPAAQWHRSLIASWAPTADVADAQDPGGRPLRDLCLKIIRGAGVAVPGRVAEHFFLVTCDGLFFLRAALSHAPSVTPSGLEAGVYGLGSSYASAMTFGTRFTTGLFAGANILRIVAYQDGCGCFRYTRTSMRTG